MEKYYLQSQQEEALKSVGINPDYANAMIELMHNQSLYKNTDNLPPILKEFISIAKSKGINLDIEYGVVNSEVGFVIGANGKGVFVQDYIVEDESKYDEGIEWFNKSLKATFNV